MTATPAAGPDICLTGLSKHYGPFKALDNVHLTVAPGEFLTLLGPSGSGKSTLLMALAGFVEPTRGDITVGGRSVVALAPEKRDFGVVFQGYALFPHMSVADNVGYPLKIRRLPKPEIAARVKEALALVQLDHLAKRNPKQLSGGQQQRVALARALVFSPEILLLDEPMGALDKKLRGDLQMELRQLHRKLGRTFVNVTHDQEEAMAMSDRIAIMRAGRIEQVGAPRDLYDMPETRFVADFLGKSNFLEGRVRQADAEIAVVETADGMIRHAQRGLVLRAGDDALLALRPQKIGLGGDGADNELPAVVETAIFLGTHAEITARTGSGLVLGINLAIDRAEALPDEGTGVTLTFGAASTTAVRDD
ncbi:ABC transporter ATP-binding protein [Zavarzinia compransoris]|uniref:ABC transporter ATP-binding protein n=1 Tax=Zavarzinia marina TaxID=2911065 RepID=UPI001F2ABE92|nr:ABC transporter ATP-binding protein [Zavarzinia marina]MCF4166312.1 ABC transporter ATP-binding protein [Zavarzinia marina]